MSRKLIVEVVGDSRSLERSFARSTRATQKFGAQTSTTLGTIEGNFTKMQRVAAGGFIGGAIAATGITALKRIVDVSSEAQQVLGQTKVAVEATGKSWQVYGRIIEKTVDQQSRFGFDDEALLRTFSLFQRTTGDVNRALTLNNLAMDVARARFIDLEQAAQLVNKAALGQAGALRRLGIDTKGVTDPTQLLILLTEKYGGSAKAASKDARTAMDRTNVAVENLQESMGTLLLPAVEGLADALTEAANNASQLVTQLQKLGSVRVPEIKIPFSSENIPGTGGTIGDAVGFAIKKGITHALLGGAAPIIEIKSLVDRFMGDTENRIQTQIDNSPFTFRLPPIKLVPAEKFDQLPGVHFPGIADFGKNLEAAIQAAQDAATKAVQKGRAAITKAAADKAKEDQRTAFANLIDALSLKVDRAAATKGIRDDLAANTQLQNAIKNQIKIEGRTTDLARQLFEARQARADILAGKATEAAAAARRANEAAAAERQARQFKALGLTGTGGEPVPGVANLAKRLKTVLGRISSGDLDVSSKLVSRLKASRRLIKQEGGKLTEDTRNVINDFLKAASGQDATTKTGGPLTKGSAINAGKILEGLLLPPGIEATLRARLSKLNSAAGLASPGRVARNGSTFTQPAVVVESHTTIQMDRDVVARAVTRSQQRTRRRNPPQKRGPSQ